MSANIFFTSLRRNRKKNLSVHIRIGVILCVSRASPGRNNTFDSFTNRSRIHLGKSATNLTSAMTILCSIIMCFRSLSCSAAGTRSSQKIQGTDGEASEVVVPPGPSGRESGSRMQSLLSGGDKVKKKKRMISHLLH